jgi:hypothetical protein
MVLTGARGGSVTLDGETCRDMTCPPFLEVGPEAAPVEDNSMKLTPEQLERLLEAFTWFVLVYILAAPVVLPQIAHALNKAAAP